jgi:hypothetical protein
MTRQYNNQYKKLLQQSDKSFLRVIGLKKYQFEFLLELFLEYVDNNWDKRGCKGGFSLADKLLLTFRYLRSYPTFLELGVEFGISESYANKIFTKVSESLVKILKLPNLNSLKDIDLGDVLIDVSEQETQRPKKNNS